MKRILFTLTLLASFSIGLKAQVEFAPVGASWYYEYVPDVFQFDFRQYWKVTAAAEVQLGGETGKQLIIEARDQYLGQWTDTLLLWQDGQQVFFHEQDSFYLLYDFSLETGDTLEVNIPDIRYYDNPSVCGDFPHEPISMLVDSTGTLEVNGELRKIQFLEYLDPPGVFFEFFGPVTEGIGSFHFLAPPCKVDVFEGGYFTGLRCYEDEQTGLYKRVSYACDSVGLITSIYTENTDRLAPPVFTLSPNPAREQMRLQLDGRIPSACRLEVSNLAGKTFFQVPLQGYSGEALHLSVGEWPAGLYVVKVWSPVGEMVGVEKVVVRGD